ncbi:hypothetical protein [Kallipyga massiliensis]|uniref:hypothetical protein n=1 Tax=Kallipyga massiliensis TaxID=1472764 RepID=UPI000559C1B8|nr:hypothetical protein [Kallipyga massiliensis]
MDRKSRNNDGGKYAFFERSLGMKLTKRFLAVLLAMVLVGGSLPVMAASETAKNTPKDEVVYVSMDNRGKTKSVHVVNAFRPEEDTTILDYGNYESLVNLTNDQEISRQGDKIRVPVKAGQFFYQGNAPKEELPWLLSLEYKLDGKTLEPKELAGQKGEVELLGKVRPNHKAKAAYTDYYMAQLTLSFDTNKVEVLDGGKAQVAYQGSKQSLTFLALPGEDLDFTVKLKARDFAMEAITMAGIPFSMDVDLPDTEEVFSGLSKLETGIRDLDTGTKTLASQGGALSQGTKDLYAGMEALRTGASKAAEGQNTIIQGQTRLQEGLSQYAGAIGSLVDQVEALGGNLGDLTQGVGKLEEGSKELEEGMTAFSQGLSAYTGGVGQLARGQDEFTQGLGALVDQSSALKKGGEDLLQASQSMVDALSNPLPEGQPSLDPAKLAGLKQDFQVLAQGLQSLQDQVKKMDPTPMIDQMKTLGQGLVKLESSLNQETLISQLGLGQEDLANPAVQKLLGTLGQVQSQVGGINQSLGQGLADYQEKIQESQKDMEDLKANLSSMEESMGQVQALLEDENLEKMLAAMGKMGEFNQGLRSFHEGLSQYVGGNHALLDALVDQVYPGAQDIQTGLGQLNQEGGKLVSGFGQIKDGQDQLIGGIKKFASAGSGLDLSQMGRIQELKAGIDTILVNHNRLLGGQKELAAGLETLSGGLGSALEGMAGYQEGLARYLGGIDQLAGGTGQMAQETGGMAQEAQDRMDEALGKFTQEGFHAESFTSEKNTQLGLVQFVYMSDGIQKEEEVTPAPVQEEKSLWDKFLDLFR